MIIGHRSCTRETAATTSVRVPQRARTYTHTHPSGFNWNRTDWHLGFLLGHMPTQQLQTVFLTDVLGSLFRYFSAVMYIAVLSLDKKMISRTHKCLTMTRHKSCVPVHTGHQMWPMLETSQHILWRGPHVSSQDVYCHCVYIMCFTRKLDCNQYQFKSICNTHHRLKSRCLFLWHTHMSM